MTILGGSFRHNNTKPPSAIIIPLLIAQTPSTFDRTTTASGRLERHTHGMPIAAAATQDEAEDPKKS